MPVLEVSLLHVAHTQFGSFHSELQFVVADFVRDLSVLLCHHFPYCQEREVESAKKILMLTFKPTRSWILVLEFTLNCNL